MPITFLTSQQYVNLCMLVIIYKKHFRPKFFKESLKFFLFFTMLALKSEVHMWYRLFLFLSRFPHGRKFSAMDTIFHSATVHWSRHQVVDVLIYFDRLLLTPGWANWIMSKFIMFNRIEVSAQKTYWFALQISSIIIKNVRAATIIF